MGRDKIFHSMNFAIQVDERCEMGVNYKRLWKRLIDDEMETSDLHIATGIAPSTFSKMRKSEYVSLGVLVRICKVLKCQLSEIVEVELDNRS